MKYFAAILLIIGGFGSGFATRDLIWRLTVPSPVIVGGLIECSRPSDGRDHIENITFIGPGFEGKIYELSRKAVNAVCRQHEAMVR